MPPAEERTAAALADPGEAEALMDDLLSLLDAGLVIAIEGSDQARYAPTDITTVQEAA